MIFFSTRLLSCSCPEREIFNECKGAEANGRVNFVHRIITPAGKRQPPAPPPALQPCFGKAKIVLSFGAVEAGFPTKPQDLPPLTTT
jgi:hypothetical protein